MQSEINSNYYPENFPPAWASEWGEDSYGLFSDFCFDIEQALVQRFRWIASGDFMMGSPHNEAERMVSREDYHRVNLTQGYWLADTTVTQNLWQEIMGENKAHFKGGSNPVENVSWNDAQEFINKLKQQFNSDLENLLFRLPTEVEWEHACRAGTNTPFYLGENISPEQVNYNGDYSYANGTKGQNRQQTVAVKHFQANPWGLYEMHGNVWEWCADVWKEKLGELPVTDPYYDKRGAFRVVRGGSWHDYGRYVRSAVRYHYSPDVRFNSFGFRLSLGHELPVAEQKEGGA